MTEIGMALSNPYDGPRVPGAVGRPLPGVAVDIADDAGHPVPHGEPGELRVRTPQLFSGYHADPAATAAAFDPEGRFRTGDTGVRDEAGVIRLLGRTSIDIIKSGGYKLSALEIEAVLLTHPAIAEVAVLGLPDPTWGEVVTAFVVPRPGNGTTTEPTLTERAGLRPRAPRALQDPARPAGRPLTAPQRDGQAAEAAPALVHRSRNRVNARPAGADRRSNVTLFRERCTSVRIRSRLRAWAGRLHTGPRCGR